MESDIFIIRSNITPMIHRLEQLAKEKEEKEKEEREERWKREREERELKESEWKKEHPILDKFTYISSYNFNSYSWMGDYIKVNFYEWSDINRSPRYFPYSTEFYRFLDASKLNLTNEQNALIKSCNGCHITCAPGSHDLIVGSSYEDLKGKFNLTKILSTVPDGSSQSS